MCIVFGTICMVIMSQLYSAVLQLCCIRFQHGKNYPSLNYCSVGGRCDMHAYI